MWVIVKASEDMMVVVMSDNSDGDGWIDGDGESRWC